MSNVEVVKGAFGNDADYLTFEEKEDYIKVSPRQFLGTELFARIGATVRELDGDYVSAGKESHFRIPKKQSETTESTPQTELPPALPQSDESKEPASELEHLKMMFPEDLENLLNFTEKENEKGKFIMVKPREFLGSENFAKIASVVRAAGGDYISAGKDSHFRVPITQ